MANGSLGHERTLLWMSFAQRLRMLVKDFTPHTEVDTDRFATSVMDRQALELPGSAALARRSFSGTIAGGTSEIQRNIIAQRVLGLPRA